MDASAGAFVSGVGTGVERLAVASPSGSQSPLHELLARPLGAVDEPSRAVAVQPLAVDAHATRRPRAARRALAMSASSSTAVPRSLTPT